MDRPRLRVAIVDDDKSVRKALRRLLRAAQLEAEAFPSGVAFIQSLGRLLPDCVILDLHMPDMNGLDVQRHIVSTGLALPVVIITGHDEPTARLRCLSFGAAAYLCKPLDDQVLLEAVERAAARSLAP